MDKPNIQHILNSPELQSGDLESYLFVAHNYMAENQNDIALLILSETVEKFPNSDKAHFEFGYFLYELDKFTKASEHLKRSIELDPSRNPKKYFTLAEISDPKDSITLYETGINLCQKKLNKPNITGTLNRNKKKGNKQAYCTGLFGFGGDIHAQ